MPLYKDHATILNDLRQAYYNDFGQWPGSLTERMFSAVALILEEQYGYGAEVEGDFYIATSEGEKLHARVADIGLTAKPGAYATGTFVFTSNSPADQDYPITTGTQVSSDDNAIVFTTTIDAVLPKGGTATVPIPIRCTIQGAVGNVRAVALTRIPFRPAGVNGGHATQDAQGGVDPQDDQSLRDYVPVFLQGSKRGTLAAVSAGTLSVTGVNSTSQVEDLPDRQILQYVEDGSGSAPLALLAAVITELVNWRPGGIRVQVLAGTRVEVTVQATIGVKNGFDPNAVLVQVQANIVGYVNSLPLGQGMTLLKLTGLVINTPGVGNVVFAQPTGDYAVAVNQCLRTTPSEIVLALAGLGP